MVGHFLRRSFVLGLLVAGCAGRSTSSSKQEEAGGTGASGGTVSSGGSGATGGSVPGTGGVGGSGGSTGGNVSMGGNVSTGATAGTGGTNAQCRPPIIACTDCKRDFLLPDCVNGAWRCPFVDCPLPATGGSAGSSGVAGMVGTGGEAGDGGDPLDPIGAACWSFCRTWESACPNMTAQHAVCDADCIAGNADVPERCAPAAAAYLYCAGTPDDCRDRTATPAGCVSEESVYLACVLGDVPSNCLRNPPTTGFDGCKLETFCGADGNYSISCDSEDDGSGTSLCDCSIDGVYEDALVVNGIGALACARAAELCGPP